MDNLNINNILNNEIPPIKTMEMEVRRDAENSLKNPYTVGSNAGSDILSAFTSNINKPNIEEQIPISEGYDLVGGEWLSKFPSYKIGRDNTEFAAQNQSGLEQALNGTLKAVNNVGAVVVGNTAGFVYGLADWAKTGNFNSVFDNSFSKTLDDWNSKLNYQLPNYYTKKEQEAGFFGAIVENPANFFFNDVANGISFTVGTIASEAIWAYATGGASIALKGGQWGAKLANIGKFGKAALGVEKTAQGLTRYKGFVNEALTNAVRTGKLEMGTARNLAKAGEVLNTVRFIATSSGNEAGIEAFHFKKEATENFYNSFKEINGREPNAEEVAEFTKNVEQAANGVFATNMAILGVSNLAMIGNMFNVKSPISSLQKQVNKKLFGIGVEKSTDGTFKAIQRTGWNKAAGALYIPISATVREGMFEEGLQGATTKTANYWIERQYDPKYINKTLSLMDDAMKAMHEQYTSKEGWKEIGIGGLVGILGGGFTGEFSRFSRQQKEQEDIVAKGLNAQQNTLTTLVGDITARRIQYNATQLALEDEKEQALASGDVVASRLAQNASIIAGLQFEDNPVVQGDPQAFIDKMITAVQANDEVSQEEKDVVIEGIKTLGDRYSKVSSFAESIVGGQGRIYGTKQSSQHAKEALTFSILQGENANLIMQSSLEEMQQFLDDDAIRAIKLSDELSSLRGDRRRKASNIQRRYKRLDEKIKQAQQEAQKIQASPNEVEGNKQLKLVENQQKLIALENEKQALRAEAEVLSNEIAQNKKLNKVSVTETSMLEEFISVEELLNLDEKLDNINSIYSTLQTVNPIASQQVKALMDTYNNARDKFYNYQATAQAIGEGKFKARIANDNPFSKLVAKFQNNDIKGDEYTKEFLDTLFKIWNNTKADVISENQTTDVEKYKRELDALNQKETLTEDEQNRKEELVKLISDLSTTSSEVKDDTPTKQTKYERLLKELEDLAVQKAELEMQEKTPVIKRQITNLNKKIKSIESQLDVIRAENSEFTLPEQPNTVEGLKTRIKNILDLFQSDFVGENNVEEKAKNRPDQKDIDRYRELKNDRLIQEYELSGQLPLDTTIIDEFETLKEKLSQWRVYDSLMSGNESVADLLDLVAQLEQEVNELETIDNPTLEELTQPQEDEEWKGTDKTIDYSLTQNTNFPATMSVTKQGEVIITHQKPSRLLSRFVGATFKVKNKEKSLEELDNLKEGDVITVEDNGISRKFKIGYSGRIVTSKEDFLAIPNVVTTNTTIDKVTNWSYSVMYEIDANGNTRPIESHFKDNEITGDTHNLQAEDTIEFYVNVEEEYNKKLLEDFNKGKISEQEAINQVRITVRKNKEVYQTLKALNIENIDENVLTLRQRAFEQLKSGKSQAIGTTKVDYVQLGLPILSVTENGALTQQDITENGVQNVVATGYVQDGEIVLNNEKENVRRTFIKKISEKYKGSKVPIVVIKRGNQLIAFPITMNKVTVSKRQGALEILERTDITDAQKVKLLNDYLINNNISPKRFNMVSLEEEVVNRILDVLDNQEDFISGEQLADKNYKKENLVNDAKISLDLENLSVSLPSQKININLDNISIKEMKTSKDKVAEEEEVNKKVNKVMTNITKPQRKAKQSSQVKSDIEAKKADIERRRQEELNNKEKFVSSKKRQEKEGGSYKEIDLDDIDLESSNLEELVNDGVTKIIVLEERGLNADGKKVATVRIITKNGAENFEVFLNTDKINAKYDAELKSLENKSIIDVETLDIVDIDLVEDISKYSEEEIKKVAEKLYRSKGDVVVLTKAEQQLYIDEARAVNNSIQEIKKEVALQQKQKTVVRNNVVTTKDAKFTVIDEYGKQSTYNNENGLWGYMYNGKFNAEYEKNQEYYEWLFQKSLQTGGVIKQSFDTLKEEFKALKELEKTDKDVRCK